MACTTRWSRHRERGALGLAAAAPAARRWRVDEVTATQSSTRLGRLPMVPRRQKYKVLLALLLVSIVIQTHGLHTGVVGWTRHFTGGADDGALALAFNLLSSVFLCTAVAVVLRDVFRSPEADLALVRHSP